MKIVDRNTFLRMPAGTVFMKFPAQPKEPRKRDYNYDCVIRIKGDSSETDFCAEDLFPTFEGADDFDGVDAAITCMLAGKSVKTLYDGIYWDRLWEIDQLFMVWEPADLAGMIERLQKALIAQRP